MLDPAGLLDHGIEAVVLASANDGQRKGNDAVHQLLVEGTRCEGPIGDEEEAHHDCAKDARQAPATFECGYAQALPQFRALRRAIGAPGKIESRLSRRLGF